MMSKRQLGSYHQDLEFFDLSNATENEIKEIKDILSCNISNGCVELPWDVTNLPVENCARKTENGGGITATCEEQQFSLATTATSLNTVVGQALLYAPPAIQAAQATQLPIQSLDGLQPVEAFIPPSMTAASPMGPHYPAPFVGPRTVSVLRAYPHVGVPLFTCTIPSTGEMAHMASPYAPFLPLAAPVAALPQTHLEKSVEHEERPKLKVCDDRQFNRRGKKKHTSTGGYYASGSDTYETVIADDQLLTSANVGSNRLAAVPCVPVPMPPSTFPVTSGALPLPSYPPGLHPLSYSQISGPQHPTTPVYYVPLFNHSPYSRYIPSAAAPMMVPVTSVNLPSATVHHTSESECSTLNDVHDDLKSYESLAASTESIGKTSESSAPIESDSETGNELNPTGVQNSESPSKEDTTDNCSQNSAETLNKTCRLKNLKEKLGNAIDESSNDRSWADLFKKKCNEMNGVRHAKSSNQSEPKKPKPEKNLTNGKPFNVPM